MSDNMEPRQEQLLNLVIETYIKTAEPVGSRFLVNKAGLDWSEATVRNELRELEEAGFLTHPHTSAGRIPTIEGYRHYIDALELEKVGASKPESVALEKAFDLVKEYEQARKNVAKALGELSQETVLVAFSPDQFYYTGLTHLFQKPDFAEVRLVASLSQVFDQCEEYLPLFFKRVSAEPKFFLGKQHPFGEMLSLLAVRFGQQDESLIAILGPQRMDYKRNWSLLKKVKELI